jgi:hypothetical protein
MECSISAADAVSLYDAPAYLKNPDFLLFTDTDETVQARDPADWTTCQQQVKNSFFKHKPVGEFKERVYLSLEGRVMPIQTSNP